VLAALGAPALVDLGVPLLGAHLFIFYFGCISNVTPPVSLAAYAAAGIANSPPLKTAWTAMGLASAGFLVPFMFIYAPQLLLVGSVGQILLTTLTAIVGVIALAGAVIGYVRGPLGLPRRLVLFGAALALISPSIVWDGVGLALFTLAGLVGSAVRLVRGGPPEPLDIGGPDGLAEQCLKRAQQRWSLSLLTLPHSLVRVVVAEQIYRAWSILNHHPYHRS